MLAIMQAFIYAYLDLVGTISAVTIICMFDFRAIGIMPAYKHSPYVVSNYPE